MKKVILGDAPNIAKKRANCGVAYSKIKVESKV